MSDRDTSNPHNLPKSSTMSVTEIDKGLASLWQQATGQTPKGSLSTVTRVCTANLVVLMPGEMDPSPFVEAAATVAQTHPVRVLVLVADREPSSAESEGQVSGSCLLTATGNVQICCEQIQITLRGEAVDDLPSFVTGFLVPDLPVILWWVRHPMLDTETIEPLEPVIDCLVVDSGDFGDSLAGLRRLAGVRVRHPGVRIGDVNWSRLVAWREVIAQAFDTAEVGPYIDRIDGLEIAYATGALAQAIELGGWFAGRLRWYPSGDATEIPTDRCERSLCRPDRGRVAVKIAEATQTEQGFGGPVSVTLSADGGKMELRFVRSAHDQVSVMTRTGGAESTRSVTLRGTPLSSLIEEQIDWLGADGIFHEALTTALRIFG